MTEAHTFFKCPRCGTESTQPEAIIGGYCAECQDVTAMYLEELDEMPVLVGRVQTALMVLDGETFVVLMVYDTTGTVLAQLRLHPDHAIHWTMAVGRASLVALEDQAVRHAGT